MNDKQQLAAMGAQYRLTEEQAKGLAERMPELNCSLRQILGRPNFSCITIAEALRLAGHAIERKAEHEQAAVIHWLLGFYFSHGDNWIDASRAALKDMRDTAMLAAAPSPDSIK